jgi:hypothetical protein
LYPKHIYVIARRFVKFGMGTAILDAKAFENVCRKKVIGSLDSK